MIRVVASNRTERLVAELAGRVRSQQRDRGVLTAVSIVVPGAALEDHVRLGIARECGIAANLDLMRITRFAEREVAERLGGTLAGADELEAMALRLLLDPAFTAHPDLEAVRAYVEGGPSPEAADVRRVQLAARVGRLFEEYTYSRPELLSAWPAGPTLRVGPRADAERWQRRLWLGMWAARGLGRERGLVPLHEAVATMGSGDAAAAAGRARDPEAHARREGDGDARVDGAPLHVFAFAHFARVFHGLLARAASSREVVVYSLSPCEGFWEDFDPNDPAPLELWGRPGREQTRALDAASGFDHEDGFVPAEGPSLLAQVQRDLLRREAAPAAIDPAFRFDADESILVLEHASIRRELEAVASDIWRLVERDATLRFDDVAVLVPDSDAAAYLAHLPAVFREAHDLPHRLVDLPVPGDGRVIEAVELLLALPLGRFTRQELLRLAVHPAVVAALDGVDAGGWTALCDRLGILHGADRSDHEDTYIARDILNWDQGLRRLALGVFMAGDASGERRPFELEGEGYVPHEVGTTELGDAAAFGVLVRSLMADARFLRSGERTLAEWAAILVDLVGTYVAPIREGDAEVLVQCQRRLHALGRMDLGDRRVPYRVACELARARIATAHGGRGTDGVVVSRVGSVRAVPFRAVFACGMGEGRFPGAEADDALDLRWADRQEGDVTARERDKYAFLELLIGTRDRLYLSYVSRDPLTGDALAPSSVVAELLHALARGYVGDPAALRRRHPLRRFHPDYFPDLFGGDGRIGTTCIPEARAEAEALWLRRAFEARGGVVDRERIEDLAAVDPAWAPLADHLRLVRLPQSAASSRGAGLRPGGAPGLARAFIPMYALVKFLEFPLQGWARFRVGLDEYEDEDVLAREDEPFETHVRDETLLLRGVLLEAAKGRPIDEVYDATVRDRELRGSGPSGLFAAAERVEHLQTLAAWREEIEAHGIGFESLSVHRFGRAGEHATADRVHPALSLEVDVAGASGATELVRAEIGGRTLPLGDAEVSVTLTRRMKEGKDEWAAADRQRAVLRAFVDYAVLSASGLAEGRPHASLAVVATPEGTTAEQIRFQPISRGEATVWLRGLVREMLAGPHAYFLPCEALLVHRAKGADAPLAACLERARDLLGDGDGPPRLRSVYGPVPRPHRYPVPDEGDAGRMMAARFGLLFDKWREDA
ncbi:MAG: exodeoxyribonuclease V subunit gamma [Myxococcales bacterium]|nr:exodeoxyribonuclease V subunit gamma [Myxococcales bacterium]